MNGKNTVVPAILAIAVAIAVIAFGILANVPVAHTTPGGSTVSSSSSSSLSLGSTVTSSSPTQVTQSQTSQASQTLQSSTQSTTSQSSTSTGTQEGTLSVLLTDPPHIPSGVTKVYVSYRNLDVHVSNAGNQSGWFQLQSAGQIELLGTVNVSQTISSVKVPTGDYNALKFNITSAVVTYNGQNDTAFVRAGELIVPIVHGIEVNASVPSATIIDISPTIINIGSSSTPEFIIKSVATAYAVPSSGVTTGMQQQGYKISLIGLGWWQHVVQNYTANLQIQNATLSSTGLTVSVTDTGSNATQLTLVVVSPLVSATSGPIRGYLPASFLGDAVFAVQPNGTLTQIQLAVPVLANAQGSVSSTLFRDTGFNLTAGASASFSYTGQIKLGFLTLMKNQGAITPHQQYLVTVIGTQAIASYVVVAQ